MASLSRSQSSALLTSSHNNCSATAAVDHSPLSSPNSACFPSTVLPELDGHLPLSKVQQELTQASWQHPSASSLDKHLNSSLGFVDTRLLPAYSADGLSNTQTFKDCPAQLAESSSFNTGIWEADVGQKLVYMLPAASDPLAIASTMNLAEHCMPDGASVGEFVGRLASSAAGKGGVSSIVASSSPTLSEMEKFFNVGGSNWISVDAPVNVGLTVDTSKAGLVIQGTNLPVPSQCLPNFSTDPGFAERAAKFSCFSNQNYSELPQQYALVDHGGKTLNRSAYRTADKLTTTKLSRVPSGHLTPRCSAPNSPVRATGSGGSQEPSGLSENVSLKEQVTVTEDPKCVEKRSRKASCSPSQFDCFEGTQKLCTSTNESDDADCSLGQEVSSSCERAGCEIPSQGVTQNRGKKRKVGLKDGPKGTAGITNLREAKDLETDEEKRKRPKSDGSAKEDEHKLKVEQSSSGNSGESTPKSVKESCKPPEAPKPDYIHVRARRGQATDSHSLAERVRREKISERMKFLQDLVPSCSKVTGKAVMLDEIINYVQSLQRQVEFLSMKLAAVNPRLEFNLDSLFSKEPRIGTQNMVFAAENTSSFPLPQQPQLPLQVGSSCPVEVHSLGLDSGLRRTISTPARTTLDAFGDSVSQISQAWDDELQSVVQMGFAQGRQTPLSSPNLHHL